ncbi:zinc-binding dehydrogenase [Kitasatospora azatica]|uniref:zinc-binding dehydrogenase n=1 Tax=Kitasatospora azatica TaxID=58347 RepID=UPI000AD901FA|nr:zinc-binding dehydrogenase [Kitasatospora azatica]
MSTPEIEPGRLFIGGRWRESSSGSRTEVIDPSTGWAATTVAEADATDVDAAVRAAIGGRRGDGSGTISRDGAALGGHFFGQSSFADLALVEERSLVKVDPDVPLELIAPLGCGVQTGVGAVWNVLRPEVGATLVVLGAGAVGLSSVMAAALSPATTIIAVDRVPERLALARELGATHTVNTAEVDLAEAVLDLTDRHGADGIVETTGSITVLRQGVDALASRGTLAVVGAPPFGTEVSLDVNAMIPGRKVVGVTLGDTETQTFIPALVRLIRDGRLPLHRLISHYPFADIDQAVRDMTAGKAIKPVLTF